MKTLGFILDKNKGIGKGFDFLRIALATLVVLDHSFLIVDGNYDSVAQYHLVSTFGAILPMFFALSGFLITGSAQRLKLKDFLINRSLRIVPALTVDIVISAFLIGSVFTIVPLHDYFTDKKFAHYFLNIIGFIHYELPGVFLSNPFSNQVNGSLWTVPFEIGCYALMSIAIFSGCVKSKQRMIVAFAGFILIFYALYFLASPLPDGTPLANYLNNFISGRGNFLYFDFLGGSLLYVLRYQIPFSRLLAVLSVVVILLGGEMGLKTATPLALALPVAYLVAYIGLLPIPKVPLYSRGDYSYGVYLYAYPIQQALVALFPGRFLILPHFLCSMVLVTGVAMLSWHCVEKPILAVRKKFSFTARLHA